MNTSKPLIGSKPSIPLSGIPTLPSQDIVMLNKVVFNLAERVKQLEDTLLKVVQLSMIMEQSIMVLEAKLEPVAASDVH